MASSGPTNYNHIKVSKPITDRQKSITEMQWINVIEKYTTDNKGRLTAISKNCTTGCEVVMVNVTKAPVVYFRKGTCYMGCNTHKEVTKDTPWHVLLPSTNWAQGGYNDYSIRMDVLANPSFSPDIVYVSGTGGAASMMKWDGKWWVVYGVLDKKRPENAVSGNGSWRDESKIIVLHNVLLDGWDPKQAEDYATASYKAFAELVNNSSK